MAVYVDPNFSWPKTKAWPYGSVSHMYADTEVELHAMARRLGFKREWCSDKTQPDSCLLHYDLSPAKRAQAVKLGAVEVTHEHAEPYEYVRMWCFPEFRKLWNKESLPGDLAPAHYDEWGESFRWFWKGAVAGVDLERERVKKSKKESK